jgi:hypothetical protein
VCCCSSSRVRGIAGPPISNALTLLPPSSCSGLFDAGVFGDTLDGDPVLSADRSVRGWLLSNRWTFSRQLIYQEEVT